MTRKTLFAVAVLAIVPTGVNAQATADSDAVVRTERAEILSEQAYIVADQVADFSTAASYLREAADLWGADHQSVEALLDAGRFNYYANRKLNAVSALKTAGETAERIGDFGAASQAFRDAAWVAAEAGEVSTARELLERSEAILETVAVASLDR